MKKLFLIILASLPCLIWGQTNNYSCYRAIHGIDDTWHSIELPEDIFQHTKNNLYDIRILGIKANGDTIEAPYIIERNTVKVIKEQSKFSIINISHINNEYFFTIKANNELTINNLNLIFKNTDFDWKVQIEGSNNQLKWFSIVDEYRIISIQSQQTNYKFTDVAFPVSNYKYYRVSFASTHKPILEKVIIKDKIIQEGKYQAYKPCNITKSLNDKTNQNSIKIKLPYKVPVSYVKIYRNVNYDYYRPLSIRYITDSSIYNEKMHYSYTNLYTGTFSSFEDDKYAFSNTMVNEIEILIDNFDNEPITIDSVIVGGNVYELISRFTQKADYFLAYNNANWSKPNYDIEQFKHKIPENIKALSLGSEYCQNNVTDANEPIGFFNNKLLIWAILIAIILFLGYFSIKMLKKTD